MKIKETVKIMRRMELTNLSLLRSLSAAVSVYPDSSMLPCEVILKQTTLLL